MRLRPTRVFTAITALAMLSLAACGSSSTPIAASATSSASPGSSASAPATTSAPSSGSASGSATAASVAPPAASSGAAPGGSTSGNLTIWADDKGAPALKEAAADFGAANGITVTVQTISKDLQSTFVTASQAGNAPDLVLGAHDWIGNLVQNGAIDPVTLDDATKAKFNPLAIKGVTFNGQVYGIPFAVESVFLYRNTDLAPTAPKTMEDLVSAGEALVKAGRASQVLALPQGQNGDPYHAYPIFTAGGGTLFGKTADGTYNAKDLELDSAASLAAAKKFAVLGEKGDGALKRSINADQVPSLFTDKKTAFMVSGPWNLDAVKKSGVKYDISAVPGFAGGPAAKPFVGVQALYVAAKGKNKALAQEFATNYFATPEVAQALYKVYQRPPALIEAFDAVAKTDTDLPKEAAAAKDGDILPSIPEMQAVWTPWGVAEAAIIGGADPATSFKKAAQTIRAAIK